MSMKIEATQSFNIIMKTGEKLKYILEELLKSKVLSLTNLVKFIKKISSAEVKMEF